MGSEKMKSNFTETCSRFSQFLKERRSFGHFDAFKSIASPQIEIKGASKDVCGVSKKVENERISLELFPLSSSSKAAALESSTNSELTKSKEDHKDTTTTPSMTIFYGGKVLVFDELPKEKAQEIMSLASRGMMSTQVQVQVQVQKQNVVPQGTPNLSDLPIARRVSLHRFMEKRKHRIASSAPYQLQNSSTAMPDYHPQKFNMMRSFYEKQQLELKL